MHSFHLITGLPVHTWISEDSSKSWTLSPAEVDRICLSEFPRLMVRQIGCLIGRRYEQQVIRNAKKARADMKIQIAASGVFDLKRYPFLLTTKV